MTSQRIAVLEGDGIGPEIVPATQRVMDAAVAAVGADRIDWIPLPSGWKGLQEHGTTLPETTVETLSGLPGWVVGPHDSSGYPEPWVRRLSPHAHLRRGFELYANLRPVRILPGVSAVVTGLDLAFARENTEGFYSDNAMHAGSGQFMPSPDVALSVGVFTVKGARRIAHEAFRLARQRRKRVTVVHKALLRPSLGMYLDVAREVASEYPEVELTDVHVDAATVYLGIRRASMFS